MKAGGIVWPVKGWKSRPGLMPGWQTLMYPTSGEAEFVKTFAGIAARDLPAQNTACHVCFEIYTRSFCKYNLTNDLDT